MRRHNKRKSIPQNQVDKFNVTLQKYQKCACGYWYNNALNNRYTLTIIDLPKDTEIPSGYNDIVRTGIRTGLENWGDINNIIFSYTDSRLNTNIIIQQEEISKIRNTEAAYMFHNNQCTIRLFTKQYRHFLNEETTEWTISREFGHLMGYRITQTQTTPCSEVHINRITSCRPLQHTTY